MKLSRVPARPGCPSSEDLAAFVDGRLQGLQRERILEHLASCEDCYQVFAGVVDFQEQEEAADGGSAGEHEGRQAEVVPFPQAPAGSPVRRRFRGTPALRWAACLLAGVGGALLYYRHLTVPPDLTTRELLAPLEARAASLLGKTWFEKDLKRGGGTGFSSSSATFMLGVYWTDLETAALSNDFKMLPEIARRFHGLVAETTVDGRVEEALVYGLDPEVVSWVKNLAEQPVTLPGPALLAEIAQAEKRMDASFEKEDRYQLTRGKWAAAGWLAAKAEDAEFFAKPKNRRYLAWLLRQSEALFLPEEEVAELAEIQAAIRGAAPEAPPYRELVEGFERVINYYSNDLDDPY